MRPPCSSPRRKTPSSYEEAEGAGWQRIESPTTRLTPKRNTEPRRSRARGTCLRLPAAGRRREPPAALPRTRRGSPNRPWRRAPPRHQAPRLWIQARRRRRPRSAPRRFGQSAHSRAECEARPGSRDQGASSPRRGRVLADASRRAVRGHGSPLAITVWGLPNEGDGGAPEGYITQLTARPPCPWTGK